ncbi:cytochrome P450 [Gandjariella thermophila]|uniref:Cytochrome P450 n=1 Tax=Gandjariella thermophila TaxID=1931992 RepID=A0A4D4JH61_9PSEU|nr:cytochrome P450 [Gandjariella thermophila]GDY33978.1 cytochrome P450 [Gandjariella thermophila]
MSSPAVPSAVAPVVPFGERVWLVRGLDEARAVLADDQTFRIARTDEFVAGYSRSFFLATDTGKQDDRRRFRTALAGAVSPRRLQQLRHDVLVSLADRLAERLVQQATFDLADDYVRPYTRRASYALAGIPDDTAAELVARLQVAASLLHNNGDDPAGKSLLAAVWSAIRDMSQRGQLRPTGLPGHALQRGVITLDEAPLLTIPILDMAAHEMSGALTLAALQAVATLPADEQRDLAQVGTTHAAVWEAARRLQDIYITRVVTGTTTLGGVVLNAHDRVLLDIHAANADTRTIADPARFDPSRHTEHLAFGHGLHICMGRELAMITASVALRAVMKRGTIWTPAGAAPGILAITPHRGTEPTGPRRNG